MDATRSQDDLAMIEQKVGGLHDADNNKRPIE